MQKFAEFQIPCKPYTICSQQKVGLLELSSVWILCVFTTQKKKIKYYHFKHNKNNPQYHLEFINKRCRNRVSKESFHKHIDSGLYFVFFLCQKSVPFNFVLNGYLISYLAGIKPRGQDGLQPHCPCDFGCWNWCSPTVKGAA